MSETLRAPCPNHQLHAIVKSMLLCGRFPFANIATNISYWQARANCECMCVLVKNSITRQSGQAIWLSLSLFVHNNNVHWKTHTARTAKLVHTDCAVFDVESAWETEFFHVRFRALRGNVQHFGAHVVHVFHVFVLLERHSNASFAWAPKNGQLYEAHANACVFAVRLVGTHLIVFTRLGGKSCKNCKINKCFSLVIGQLIASDHSGRLMFLCVLFALVRERTIV